MAKSKQYVLVDMGGEYFTNAVLKKGLFLQVTTTDNIMDARRFQDYWLLTKYMGLVNNKVVNKFAIVSVPD